MESNVWTQLFAQVATCLSRLFVSLSNPKSQSNGGASQNAPANAAVSTSLSTNVTNLVVRRERQTSDAIFGTILIDGGKVCFSMERTAVCIPIGTYPGCKRFSPHLNRIVVGIDVPGRTDIEGHNANLPGQIRGCIAFGSSIDGDALDSSIAALEKVLALLPQTFTVTISESY
jgi:hypothetical protein